MAINLNAKNIDLSTLFGKTANSTPSFIGPGATRTQTLPMDTGTYQTPSGGSALSNILSGAAPAKTVGPITPTAPVVKTPVLPVKKAATPAAPVKNSQVPPQWIKPDGTLYTPQEIAANLAASAPGAAANGDIPKFAGDTLTQGPQTTEQLEQSAAGLNNARNDISVGQSDPYKVASDSGIAYTPQELTAIEKAYGGIYDPAINSALTKLDTKQKADAAALDNKNKLEQAAQQHKYDVELKQTAPGVAAPVVSTGTYVEGANPVVDSWAQRIYDGTAKITDIPASSKGLRDAVTVALNTNGNQDNGKPTTTPLGIQALQTAKDLLAKFNARKGTNVVGESRIFGGGALGQNLPGTDQYDFANTFNTLKSQLSLDASKYLKGQGSLSDGERALLASAVSSLNLAQSDGQDGEFKKTLQSVIDKLEGNTPSDSSGSGFDVPDPTGTVHTFPTKEAADSFKKAIGQ